MTEQNVLKLVGLLFVLTAISNLLNVFTSPTLPLFVLLLMFGVALGCLVASLVLPIAAIRIFVSNETERLPREFFTRRMGRALLSYVGGGIIFGIIIVVGLVLFVVPGLFLLTALVFWTIYVAVENENFITSFEKSWALTSGHRLPLFGIGVGVMLLSVIPFIIFAIILSLISPIVRAIGTAFAIAVIQMFSLSVLVATYEQLIALSGEDTVSSSDESDEITLPDDTSESV